MCSPARIKIRSKVMECLDCGFKEKRPKYINWPSFTWHHGCVMLKGRETEHGDKIDDLERRQERLDESTKDLEKTDTYKGLMNT